VLRASGLFTTLDDEAPTEGRWGGRRVLLAPGEFVPRGDPPIVCTWSSKAPSKSSSKERGSLIVLAKLGAGRHFGEQALLVDDWTPQRKRALARATVLLGVSK